MYVLSQRHPVWVTENHVNPCNSVGLSQWTLSPSQGLKIGPLAAKSHKENPLKTASHRQLIESIFTEFDSLQKVISHHRRLSKCRHGGQYAKVPNTGNFMQTNECLSALVKQERVVGKIRRTKTSRKV